MNTLKSKKEVKTFEQYMMEIFVTFRPSPLDDDIEDKFNIWMGQLDTHEYLDYRKDYKVYLEYAK